MRLQSMLLVSILAAAPAVAQPPAISPVLAIEHGLAICQSTFANRHPPSAEQVRAGLRMNSAEASAAFPKALGLVPPAIELVEAAGWDVQGKDALVMANRDAGDARASVHVTRNICAVFVHAQPGEAIDNQALLDAARTWISAAYPEIDQYQPAKSSATRTAQGHAAIEWQDNDGLSIKLSIMKNQVLGKDIGAQVVLTYRPQLPPPV